MEKLIHPFYEILQKLFSSTNRFSRAYIFKKLKNIIPVEQTERVRLEHCPSIFAMASFVKSSKDSAANKDSFGFLGEKQKGIF